MDSSSSPEYRIIKFMMGLNFVAGIIIAWIGMLIVGELSELSSFRSHSLSELRIEMIELRSITVENSRQLSELMGKRIESAKE